VLGVFLSLEGFLLVFYEHINDDDDDFLMQVIMSIAFACALKLMPISCIYLRNSWTV